MMIEIKNKWNNLCKWSEEWQRKLEKALNDNINLDNVMGLMEQLKQTARERLLTAK